MRKIDKERLFGVMTRKEIIVEFMKVMEDILRSDS